MRLPLGLGEIVIALFIVAVLIWPAARIARRLGFPAILGVLIVVPLANFVLLWFVAFAEWPALPSTHVEP